MTQNTRPPRPGFAGRRAILIASVGLALALVGHAAVAEERGSLSVTSQPAARVLIDDRDTGQTTPLAGYALPAGAHRLTLVTLDGRQKRTLGITIKAGATTKLHVSLVDD